MEHNRLFWGSRRGMLELDLVLLPFLDKVYSSLSQEDKEGYWELLQCEDQDIFAWLLRNEDPEDSKLRKIVELIRENTGIRANTGVDSHGGR